MRKADVTERTKDRSGQDNKIGKVFVVGSDVRQCLVCGEIFSRQAAAEHAEVDCYSFLELSVVYPSTGGKDVT
jgi:hypothetical protein